MKKKILISAYAISPTRGSEYAAAWNTVVNLAAQHQLWVLYGMSDNHMGDTQTMRQYIKENPMPSVNFIEVQGGWLANTINLLNKAGLGWFFYFAYYLWQKRALKAAQELLHTVDIDVVHQLGPIGFREPGFLAQLGKPLVWGPIGGMKIMEDEMLAMLPFKARMKFTVKNYINKYQLAHSYRIKQAFKNADVVISATHLGQKTIKQYFDRESHYLPEQGVTGNVVTLVNKFTNPKQEVQLVWSGSLIERKNLKMCLDALADVVPNNWALHVLGDGPQRPGLMKHAAGKGIADKVFFHGHIPRNEAVFVMGGAHLHIITSIAEDNPAVIFEALSNGVPTLTIDHCGMGDVIISNKSGVKILPDSYHLMLKKMTSVLDILISNQKILAEMHQTTLLCANAHKWDKRLKKLNSIYDEAIAVHRQRSMYPVGEKGLTMI